MTTYQLTDAARALRPSAASDLTLTDTGWTTSSNDLEAIPVSSHLVPTMLYFGLIEEAPTNPVAEQIMERIATLTGDDPAQAQLAQLISRVADASPEKAAAVLDVLLAEG